MSAYCQTINPPVKADETDTCLFDFTSQQNVIFISITTIILYWSTFILMSWKRHLRENVPTILMIKAGLL